MKATYVMLVVVPVLLGCNTGGPLPPVVVPGGDDITRGFVCTTAPTAAFSPGYVFRVNEAGSRLLVNPLEDQAQVFRYLTLFGTYSATLGRGAGLKFTIDDAVVSGTGDIGGSSGQTTKVTFTDGELVQMTDAGVKLIADAAMADLDPVAGSTYFVVRDSIQAKGVDITLSRTDEAHLGGHAGLRNLVSADPSLSFSGDSDLVIKGAFAKPLNVCIRAVRIDPPEPGPVNAEPAPVSGSGPLAARWNVTRIAAPPSVIAGLPGE